MSAGLGVNARRGMTHTSEIVATSFAYPNGRPGRDYDEGHARIVEEAGFESAVSTRWSCASGRADRFQLPRVTFWDRSPARFWLRLARTYVESYAR